MVEITSLHEFGKPPRPDILRQISFLDELKPAWGRDWGVGTQSELGKIKVCMVSRPTENEAAPELAKDLRHFLLPKGLPDLEMMRKQHASMVQILKDEGVEIIYLEVPEVAIGAYSRLKNCVPTREALMVHGGAIIPRIGLAEWRRGYEALISKRLAQIGCPILHTCVNMFDGGAPIWLDQKHLIVYVGPGTSIEGINEIRPVLEWAGVEEIHVGNCPGYLADWGTRGNWMWHLDVSLSMVDAWLALVYPTGLNYQTIKYLQEKKIDMIEVPPEEQMNFACNTLAIKPGKVIIVSGNPQTAKALRTEGIDVIEVEFSELVKIGTGLHCNTLPLIRGKGPVLE